MARLAIVFLEAWGELQQEDFTDTMYSVLALKTWMLILKVEGANRADKLRDLELGSESRKILARMMNRVLDEVCSHTLFGLSPAQHAFVKGRDIVRNVSGVLRLFWDNVDPRGSDGDPLLILLLDCSKGSNLMGREWIARVLRRAILPTCLVLATHVMVNVSVLVLNCVEHWAVELLWIDARVPSVMFFVCHCSGSVVTSLGKNPRG